MLVLFMSSHRSEKKSQSHQINEKKVAQGLKISYTPVEDEDEDEDEDFGLILSKNTCYVRQFVVLLLAERGKILKCKRNY